MKQPVQLCGSGSEERFDTRYTIAVKHLPSMTNYSVYIKRIKHSGDSIGCQLSFSIKIGNSQAVSVGGSPANKKLTDFLPISDSKDVSVSIDATEKDKYSDTGSKSGTINLKESDEFVEQTIQMVVKGIGGDSKRTATFDFNFSADFLYFSTSSLYDLIEKFEGFRPAAYRDRGSSGYPTIGIGHRIRIPEENHLLSATLTRAQAVELLVLREFL